MEAGSRIMARRFHWRWVAAVASLGWLVLSSGFAAQRSLPRLEKRDATEFNQILRENALFFHILVTFSLTAALADDDADVDLKDININLISRSLRTPQGRQIVRVRVAGAVRRNHNLELDLLDEDGNLAGKGFLGYDSGQLSFYDRNSREIISGYFDSDGNYFLDDLRLPPGNQDLANGYVDPCIDCGSLDYGWWDALNFQVGGGRIFPDYWSDGESGRMRMYWSFETGRLSASESAFGEGEYVLERESNGSINSVLFDTGRTAESFFANPYSLMPEPPRLAYLPRFTNDTGIAVTNTSGREILVTYIARHPNGALLSGDGIVNPATYRFAAGQQLAAYAAQIFRGLENNDARPVLDGNAVGWIEIFSDEGELQAMYLDGAGAALDGNVAGGTGAATLVFADVRTGPAESSEIELLNLAYDDVMVRLELLDREGRVLSQDPEFFIAGYGMRDFHIGGGSQFLRPQDPSKAGSLRVSCNNSNSIRSTGCSKLIGLATYSVRDSVASAYASQPDSAGRVLVGAHFVTGPSGNGTWETKVVIARTGGAISPVYLDIYDPEGTLLKTLSSSIDSGGQASFGLNDATFPSGRLTTGYLRARTEVGDLAGLVTVTWSNGNQSMSSAYPLANFLSQVFQFNQVAEGVSDNIEYWTGIALLNDVDRQVDARVDIFRADGTLDRTTSVPLKGYQQVAVLVRELVNEPYQRLDGYARITATEPISAIVLYGDVDSTFLSTVPGIPR
jgi:hypothetical protein